MEVSYEYPNELYLAGVLKGFQDKPKYHKMIGIVANAPYLSAMEGLKMIEVEDVPEDFRRVYMVFNGKTFHTHSVEVFIRFIESKYALDLKKNNIAK